VKRVWHRHRFAGLAVVCALLFGGAWGAAVQRVPQPGDPLPGITAQEFELFRMGLDDFLEVESAEEGLGPAFNGTSCAACHNSPAIGGVSPVSEVRVARTGPSGEFVPLNPEGETLFHLFSIPNHVCQALIPPEATVVARRVPIPLFGSGLVEAIPDATIQALADPLDLNRDGVSGRAAMIRDVGTGQQRVGRFGWKAQHATLIAFGADAYRNEMGITNDLFPTELAVGVSAERMRVCDPIPDPEDVRDRQTRRRGIDNFEIFMQLLAPVTRTGGSGAVALGENLFMSSGCATCHVPTLLTGPHPNPLFDRKPVDLFSDLLLHDVATGDGIVQGAAEAGEIRTPALWGLRLRRPFLHDGSAPTIEAAIRRHGGEAARAMQAIARMSNAEFQALVAFLRTL
jgi:CxxC motif-containing protein (DUF1111 family)